MRRIDLAGEWLLRRAGAKKASPAAVPSCVHTELIAAGEILDPFVRRAPASCDWAAEAGWVYEKMFLADDLTAFDRLVLRFEGVQGAAEVSLNDEVLGRVSNAFECVEYEVSKRVRPGKNRVAVAFAEPGGAGGGVRTPAAAGGAAGLPAAPTCGVWRGVSLLAFTGVRVSDLAIRQDFSLAGVVGLDVAVAVERYDPSLRLEVLVRVCYKGNILHEARDWLSGERAALRLSVKNPQFWWPAGLGEQPLYEVTVDLLAGRTCLEHVSRRIGLRQFAAEAAGGAARFSINRHPLFLKGASWLPADLFPARLTRVEYARLIKAAAVANMNVLRVWGGGVYESDSFYDLCDEYGVCVWHDLMLGEWSGGAPEGEALASFVRETEQNIRRLRHHPCVLVWCGGDGGGRGVAEPWLAAAAGAARRADPDRAFWPAARHEPFSLGGDGVLAARPAYPEPRAVAGYLGEDERNINHPACALHTSSADATRRVYEGFFQHFLLPAGFDNALWLSQVQQGWEMKLQMERTRVADPGGAGFVFWHLNDSWPSCSPASVDVGGRWKALHYMARRFFSPLWLCGDYRAGAGAADIHVFNDGLKAFKGELQWRVTQMDGAVAAEGARKLALAHASRDKAAGVKVSDLLRKHGAGDLILWLYLLDEQGNQVAWNFVLFCEPRELALQPPRMRAEIRSWDDTSFAVTLTSHHPALWVWISLDGLDARYDENFFCLEPEKPVRVRVTPAARLKLDQFRQILRIGSLRDTWQEKRPLMQMMAPAKK